MRFGQKTLTKFLNMRKNKKEKPKINEFFVKCDCGSEILSLLYDNEIELLELAVYSNSPFMSLWQKIRFCWRVLVYGRPYNDQIMINKNKIQDLIKFLNSV